MHFQINGFHGVLQTSGFLAPGKKFGQLEVYNEENYLGPWDIASNSETEWSYHWVMWHDVDDDGLLDCMAARYLIEIHIGLAKHFNVPNKILCCSNQVRFKVQMIKRSKLKL